MARQEPLAAWLEEREAAVALIYLTHPTTSPVAMAAAEASVVVVVAQVAAALVAAREAKEALARDAVARTALHPEVVAEGALGWVPPSLPTAEWWKF